MSDEVLKLRGVSVRRETSLLLRNINWTAHDSERWIVIGPNGAGKTTLLQVAATVLFPTEGTVEVLGERLGEVDVFDLRPRIGMTSAALAERVPSGEKVIDLVLTASYAILGRWKEEYESADVTRAVELLDALGCAHLIRRRFSTLSEGERKRVQIARALMPDPEMLLLDEPAAGLDLGGREDLLRRLSQLARDPKAPMIVLVTHHVEEVPDGFTHAMLLRRGSVLAAAQVQSGGWLVEQQQFRVGHQRPGDLHPLALALGQGGELAPDQVRAAERVEDLDRAGDVAGVVFLLPPAEDGVGRGQHQVDDLLPRRDLLGDRGAGQPDPRPQVEDVDLAEALAEYLHGALGGEHQGGGHLKQGGLARSVRPDQNPAFVSVRRPVDVAQQDRRVPPDLDASQPQHLVGHQAPFLRTPAETEPMPQRPRSPARSTVRWANLVSRSEISPDEENICLIV